MVNNQNQNFTVTLTGQESCLMGYCLFLSAGIATDKTPQEIAVAKERFIKCAERFPDALESLIQKLDPETLLVPFGYTAPERN